MKDWMKWIAIIFLALVAAHFYAQYRLADQAATRLMMQFEAQMLRMNNECVQLLGRQGFQVTKIEPPAEEEPKEEEGEQDEK